jgi:alpha-glucosidase
MHKSRLVILSIGVAALQLYLACPASAALVVTGPGGHVRFELGDAVRPSEHLTYSVTFKENAVIEKSRLGIWLDGVELSEGAQIGGVDRYELREHYPWRGVHAWATNHCHGARISIKHPKTQTAWTLEVRAFNDGVAFRQVIPGDQKARIPDETTAFVLPANSIVWTHDLGGHYEAVHQKKTLTEIQAGEWAAPPLTFKIPAQVPSGHVYGCITEAALANYSGMALQAEEKAGFVIGLGHKHPISYPYRLRYSNDIARVTNAAAISGAVTSAWRVIMIAGDLNGLVNCDLVHHLCPPPHPQFFPQGMNTDWIKPGRAVWKYLDGGANTFEEMKNFSRWAGELGFEYHVIEGFWSRWSDAQIKELVEYSRERGVGLFFWKHSKQLRTPEAREEFFKKLHDSGVAGAKIDFFDHEHKEMIDLYTTLLAEAARYQILVNFHGANKPTGEARTWPNELIREGVRGMESSRLRERARHNTTLPFTRYLAGPADYTPVHFGARRGDTTWAHQIATAAVFNEPLLTYGAHPTNLLSNPALPMIKSIPPVWEETIVLPPSEIGEMAVFARRHGHRWFLAVLNGPAPRKLNVPLMFLGDRNYETMMVRDQPEDAAAVKIENTTLTRRDSIAIDLPAGGGFIARFSTP